MTIEIEVSQLMRDTGQSLRTIQNWSDIGILRPRVTRERKGRGYLRVYEAAPPLYGERAWALLALTMARSSMPLADIRIIFDALRDQNTFSHTIGAALNGRCVIIGLALGPTKSYPPPLDWITFADCDPASVNKDRIPLKVPTWFVQKHRSCHLIDLSAALAPLCNAK